MFRGVLSFHVLILGELCHVALYSSRRFQCGSRGFVPGIRLEEALDHLSLNLAQRMKVIANFHSASTLRQRICHYDKFA